MKLLSIFLLVVCTIGVQITADKIQSKSSLTNNGTKLSFMETNSNVHTNQQLNRLKIRKSKTELNLAETEKLLKNLIQKISNQQKQQTQTEQFDQNENENENENENSNFNSNEIFNSQ
jgi:hypothetical protein